MKNEEVNTELIKEILSLLSANKDELLGKVKNPESLITEIKNINTEAAKENPSKVIIKQSLQTIRNLLEGIAGNIIAAGILYKIGLFT